MKICGLLMSRAFEKVVLMVLPDQHSDEKLDRAGGEKGSYLEMR